MWGGVFFCKCDGCVCRCGGIFVRLGSFVNVGGILCKSGPCFFFVNVRVSFVKAGSVLCKCWVFSVKVEVSLS
jgi:hypothetical protein